MSFIAVSTILLFLRSVPSNGNYLDPNGTLYVCPGTSDQQQQQLLTCSTNSENHHWSIATADNYVSQIVAAIQNQHTEIDGGVVMQVVRKGTNHIVSTLQLHYESDMLPIRVSCSFTISQSSSPPNGAPAITPSPTSVPVTTTSSPHTMSRIATPSPTSAPVTTTSRLHTTSRIVTSSYVPQPTSTPLPPHPRTRAKREASSQATTVEMTFSMEAKESPEQPIIDGVDCVRTSQGSRCNIVFGAFSSNARRPVEVHRVTIASYDDVAEPPTVFSIARTPSNIEVTLKQNTRYLVTVDYHNCAGSSSKTEFFKTNGNCTDGDVRLASGNYRTGRVEICYLGIWGTVCSQDWTPTNSKVVCQQMGYSQDGSHHFPSFPRYGLSTSPILMSSVTCSGGEKSLIECDFQEPSTSCDHDSDVAVYCEPEDPPCFHGNVRLKDGDVTSGRVEVCLYGLWGTVCDDRWNVISAGVVCQQLGFSPHGAVASLKSQFGVGRLPIVMDEVQCMGIESSLTNCTYLTSHDCTHDEDAGVVCSAVPPVVASVVSSTESNDGNQDIRIGAVNSSTTETPTTSATTSQMTTDAPTSASMTMNATTASMMGTTTQEPVTMISSEAPTVASTVPATATTVPATATTVSGSATTISTVVPENSTTPPMMSESNATTVAPTVPATVNVTSPSNGTEPPVVTLPMNTTLPPPINTTFVFLPENATLPPPPENITLPTPPGNTTFPVPPENATLPPPPENVTLPTPPGNTTYAVPSGNVTLPPPPENITLPTPPGNTTYAVPPGNVTLPPPPENITLPTPPGNTTYAVPPGNVTLPPPPENITLPTPPGNTTYAVPQENTTLPPPPGNATLPPPPINVTQLQMNYTEAPTAVTNDTMTTDEASTATSTTMDASTNSSATYAPTTMNQTTGEYTTELGAVQDSATTESNSSVDATDVTSIPLNTEAQQVDSAQRVFKTATLLYVCSTLSLYHC